MARFYFDTSIGQAFTDTEGVELTDLAAARFEAVRLLASLLRSDPSAFLSTAGLCIEVRGDRGGPLFRLEVAAASLPATTAA